MRTDTICLSMEENVGRMWKVTTVLPRRTSATVQGLLRDPPNQIPVGQASGGDRPSSEKRTAQEAEAVNFVNTRNSTLFVSVLFCVPGHMTIVDIMAGIS